jgi:hypothetical protein
MELSLITNSVANLPCAQIADVIILFVRSSKQKLRIINTSKVLNLILKRTQKKNFKTFMFMWVSGKENQERRSATNKFKLKTPLFSGH